MKKTTVDVTTEEMEMLTKLREQKAQKIKEEEERKAKEAARSTLDDKFRVAVTKAQKEIEDQLALARASLEDAVAISERYGIPFESEIVNVGRNRTYFPYSFEKKWGDVSIETREEFDIYNCSDGWEYWSTSSLNC